MKCLIADDDLRTRQVLKTVLEKPGVEFLEATNGGEAIALHQAHRPDLVIMDIEMKPVDGITATRVIHEQDARCRILILSQHDSPSFRQAAAAAGAIGYVLKDDFHAIHSLISGQTSPSAQAPPTLPTPEEP
jgi:two-component system response regulator DegU